jgi:hypothetical protein
MILQAVEFNPPLAGNARRDAVPPVSGQLNRARNQRWSSLEIVPMSPSGP